MYNVYVQKLYNRLQSFYGSTNRSEKFFPNKVQLVTKI